MDNEALAPADLLVVAKMAASGSASASVRRLGDDLGISKSAVANSLHRLRAHGLLGEDSQGGRRVNVLALRDCIEHGVRWISRATIGDFELGLPTAHAIKGMAAHFTGDDDPLVMALAHGPVRGRAVTPLHPAAPLAASRDPKLHYLLALIDVFRIGRARDRQVAAAELRAFL
jgi:biotin operon repressor